MRNFLAVVFGGRPVYVDLAITIPYQTVSSVAVAVAAASVASAAVVIMASEVICHAASILDVQNVETISKVDEIVAQAAIIETITTI